MNKKLISAFSVNDEQAVADEITTLIADCLKRENERLRERLALEQRISKRPMIYACGIKELPPHIVQGGALAMLKFTCTALFPIVTEKEFETLPYDEIIGRLKKRIDYGDGLLEAVKVQCAGLKNDIAAVGVDAHAGRVAAEKLADELEGWREWIALCVRKSGGNKTDQAQADAPQMFVAVRDAIYQLWQEFNAEPADCEMRDGSLRKPGQKRTYAEFVEQHGAMVVYTSPATERKYYLSEYCRNAEELEKAINAARMAKKRKPDAKNSPHKCRTRKRQK